METFVTALFIAIPGFTILIGIEALYGWYKGFQTANAMDSISSLSSGITNITKDVLGLSIAIISYSVIVKKIALFDLPNAWWIFALAFVGKDFAGYWIHRMEHMVNWFWNRHIIHHSSEEFNLSCALRQSISEIFSYTAFFLLPMALLGVPAEIFAIVAPVHLFAQFWYHTRHINRMGFLEKIIVTPSHHRVHHAINPEYIDKNFSQIFIGWDKLFGTFQEEKAGIPCVYGVKKAVRTWNPILINYQHAWGIFKDFWRTNSILDKARIWFMPTGWRPEDVKEKYPIEIIDDVFSQEKYHPQSSEFLKAWSFFQLSITLLLSLFLFYVLADLPLSMSIMYGGFVFFSVFAYTSLMDRKWWAVILEGVKSIFGISVIIYSSDWFLISQHIPGAQYFLFSYFLISFLVVAAFVKFEIAGNLKRVLN